MIASGGGGYTSDSSPVSPEYATVNKSFDTSPTTIPEYAVVQKPKGGVKIDKGIPEYATVQKPPGGKKNIEGKGGNDVTLVMNSCTNQQQK